ncbi:sporulation histidine kinase inhibitor Sda [Cytobacillus sp. Hz8]
MILSDEELVEVYHKGISLKLDPLFIKLIEKELIKRGIKLKVKVKL